MNAATRKVEGNAKVPMLYMALELGNKRVCVAPPTRDPWCAPRLARAGGLTGFAGDRSSRPSVLGVTVH